MEEQIISMLKSDIQRRYKRKYGQVSIDFDDSELLLMYTTENEHLTPLHERMKKRMNKYTQQPLPLFVTCVILGALLVIVIIFFGVSANTRGPIEILLALLLAALALLARALVMRSR